MEQGPGEQKILEQAYRRGIPPPDAIKDAPSLREDLSVYWEAFQHLSTCRAFAGMNGVPGPIPWTAIETYALRHEFVDGAFDDLVIIIREMDSAYGDYMLKKQEEQD